MKTAYIIYDKKNYKYIFHGDAIQIFWTEEKAHDHAKFLELTDYEIHECQATPQVN